MVQNIEDSMCPFLAQAGEEVCMDARDVRTRHAVQRPERI